MLTADNRDRVYLVYRLLSGETEVGAGTVLFVLPKDFHFERPQINVDVKDLDDRYEIRVTTDCFAKSVVLDTRTGDCIFSDNWIDVSHGRARPVTVLKSDVAGIESVEDLRRGLVVRSLNDIMIRCSGVGWSWIAQSGQRPPLGLQLACFSWAPAGHASPARLPDDIGGRRRTSTANSPHSAPRARGVPRRRTGADLRSALEHVPPPDERFAGDIAAALAHISAERNDPWAGA